MYIRPILKWIPSQYYHFVSVIMACHISAINQAMPAAWMEKNNLYMLYASSKLRSQKWRRLFIQYSKFIYLIVSPSTDYLAWSARNVMKTQLSLWQPVIPAISPHKKIACCSCIDTEIKQNLSGWSTSERYLLHTYLVYAIIDIPRYTPIHRYEEYIFLNYWT